MSNLQIELKRHKLQQEFLEQVEFGNHSQETKSEFAESENHIGSLPCKGNVPLYDSSPGNYSPQTKPPITIGASRLGARDKTEDTHLDLQDTEHQELKVGIKSNGQKYSVRTNRKRFFYPNEWNNFLECLASPKQKLSFDILINTGCRYNEGYNIRKRDIDFERGFNECWRVLEDYGVLLLKWNDHDISYKNVLQLFPEDPLFSNRTSGSGIKKASQTYWFCFMKIPMEEKSK